MANGAVTTAVFTGTAITVTVLITWHRRYHHCLSPPVLTTVVITVVDDLTTVTTDGAGITVTAQNVPQLISMVSTGTTVTSVVLPRLEWSLPGSRGTGPQKPYPTLAGTP